MADLFNIIRANLERSKPKDKSSFEPTFTEDKNPRRHRSIEDLIIGEEEKNYKEKQNEFRAETPIEDGKNFDILDQQFGDEKDKPNVMQSVNRINFVELDKLPIKTQIKDLKREYLNLLDRLDEANGQLQKLDKGNSEKGVELHQAKKETQHVKDVIRNIALALPDGVELKKKLETATWEVGQIERELTQRIQFVVDRVKNVDTVIKKELEKVETENKVYKKNLVKYEAKYSELETKYNEVANLYNQATAYINDIQNKMQEQMVAYGQQIQAQVQTQMQAQLQQIQAQLLESEKKAQKLEAELQEEKAKPKTQQVTPVAPEAKEEKQIVVTPQFGKLPEFKPFVPPVVVPTPEVVAPVVEEKKEEPTPVPVVEKAPEPATPVAEEVPSTPSVDLGIDFSGFTPVAPPAFAPIETAPSISGGIDIDEPEEVVTPESVDDEDDEVDSHIIIDIDRYLETLPDSHKLIIKTIGNTGVSRNQELREILEENQEGRTMFFKGNKFSYQDMSAIVKTLRDGGFLDAEKVKLGSRGGYNFTVFELTQLGKAIHKSLTGKKSVVSEKKLITNQHASLEHGFLIKDCAQIFDELGYTVYRDRKDLTYKLSNGKRKDFDIIIEKDGVKQFIEVERGTHNDEDFFDAMDKIYQVTQDIYFIAPNEEKLFGKTKVQVFKWIKERLGGMDKAKGKLTVNFATFEKVKKKGPSIWETIKL